MNRVESQEKFGLAVGNCFALATAPSLVWLVCANSNAVIELHMLGGKINNRDAEEYLTSDFVTKALEKGIIRYKMVSALVNVGITETRFLDNDAIGISHHMTAGSALFVISRKEGEE